LERYILLWCGKWSGLSWLRIETKWRSLVNTAMKLQVVMDLDVDVDWMHLAQDYDQWRTSEHNNELSVSIEDSGCVDWRRDS
jgi:plasmid maintenance system antidote protein VapI